MSNEIAQYTLTDVVGTPTDKSVDLQASEIARKFAFGADWTDICIACLLGVNSTSNVTLSADAFRMGLTTNNEFDLEGGSPHWFGLGLPYNSATLVYSATHGLYTSGLQTTLYRSVSGSAYRALVASVSHSFSGIVDGWNAHDLTPMVMRFVRATATSIAIYFARHIPSSAYSTPTVAQLEAALATGTLGAVCTELGTYTGASFSTVSMGSLSVDEATNGYFDSLSICWADPLRTLSVFSVVGMKWA